MAPRGPRPLSAKIAFGYDSRVHRRFPANPPRWTLELIVATIVQILIYLIRTYSLVLLASAILRLVRADESNGLVRFIHTLSDPPARALTRRFPKLVIRSGYQIVDLGPIVLLVGLGCIIIALENLHRYIMGL